MEAQQGQRALVTGATGGIGEAIVRRLAAQGMEVILVGRTDERLSAAAERVREAVPEARLRLERADLSLMGEVRALAERLAAERCDAVINNAAITVDPARTTAEGLPVYLATNHLAPYVLMRVLGEAWKGFSSRFVVVGASPSVLRRTPVDLDDLETRRPKALGVVPSLRPLTAYGRTKNMNTMFVYSLAERLEGPTVNGAHPGIISGTGLGRNTWGIGRALATMFDLNPRKKWPDEGADNPAWLASAPEVEGITGRFYVERRAVPTAPHTTDHGRCERLWEQSARLVGMDP